MIRVVSGKISWIIVFLWLAFTACTDKKGIEEEYRELAEASKSLTDSHFWVLQPDSSVLEVYHPYLEHAHKPDTFFLHAGTLITENEQIAAGFFSGNLSDGFKKWTPQKREAFIGLLTDSVAKTRRTNGKLIRAEMVQCSRLVARSGFKEIQSDQMAAGFSHQLQVKWTMADSTLPITIPLNIEFEKAALNLNGRFDFNPQDFGFPLKPEGKVNALIGRPISIQLKLRFKPYVEP